MKINCIDNWVGQDCGKKVEELYMKKKLKSIHDWVGQDCGKNDLNRL